MTSPNRSVIVRLAMEPSSYIAGASKAAAATTALNGEVAKVGGTTATSMERAAKSASATEGVFGKLNKASGVLGVNFGTLAAAGGAVAAALSVKSAGDFQQSLTKLSTTAGESTKNLNMVGDGLLDMAGKVGISAGELAKGMYTVESGGFHGAAGLTVMKAAAQGAVQEQADLGKVTDAVTTILHDYHLKASDASTVTSQLVTAVSHGKTTFDELTGSLHSVTPLAAKMGISLADITGTLSSMTASGESADQATQNMANTLQHLAAPTQTMISELAQLGISTDDLATSLSTKGLSGTLQMVETAIVDHVDPATQRVLLPALNKSKTAAQDLQIMLGQMPPTLAKLSQGLTDGSVTFGQYRKAVQDLGGPSSAMGKQFLALFESSQGFNNVLKQGGPASQVFTAAMQKAFGTTAALNVALQTTGENAGATNAAIKDIGKATGDASGNIKGWAEVQGNFNQQLHEAEAAAGALAIQFGQHLLPVLTTTLGFVTHDGIPAIKGLASGFTDLPGPVREVAVVLAGLGIANAIGLTGTFAAGMSRLGSTFTSTGGLVRGFGDELTVQQRLSQMNAVSISEIDRALGGLNGSLVATGTELTAVQRMMAGWDAALASTAVEEDVAAAGAGRFSTAVMTAGLRAGEAATTGIGGFVNALGGPWGVAIGAAIIGIPTLANGFELLTGHVIDSTAAQQSFRSALEASNGVIDDTVRKNIAQQLSQAGVIDSFKRAGISAADAIAGIEGNRAAQERVTKALQDYITTSISTEGRNNANAQSAAKARDAYTQLEGAFGGSRQQADYFSQGVGHVTTQVDNATVAVRNLQAQIDNLHGRQITIEVLSKGSAGPSAYAVPGSGIGGFAGGGWTGPGMKYTPAGFVHADEFVFTKEQTNAAGVGRLAALAAALDRGYAGGGLVTNPTGGSAGYDPNAIKVLWDTSAADAAIASAKKSALTAYQAFAPGAPSNVLGNAAIVQSMAAARGWTGAEWNALYALVMRESGFRNTAQNPTSTAYGMFQFLNSTWGAYGGGKTSDPAAQTRMGLDYIAGKYRDPLGAWAHETKFGWYHDGGVVQGPVGADVPAVLRVGETVRTAEQEQSVQQQLRSREVGGTAGGAGLAAALREAMSGASFGDFVGLAVYGDVHTDPDELARRATQRSRRLLSAAGVKV